MTHPFRGPLLLGLDVGSTVTKAVVFAADGTERGRAQVRRDHDGPSPGRVERGMDRLWADATAAIRDAVGAAAVSPTDIQAIGVTGHGDGLYLLDAAHRPVRPAILSLDRRARDIVAAWEVDGVAEAALHLTGQWPWAGSTATLLRWLVEHEQASVERTRSVLSCKDWIRFGLTGVLATDRTEAGSSLSSLRTPAVDARVLALLGIDAFASAMPQVAEPCVVVGGITALAARTTGLAEGTRVVTGLHDISACAVGAGAIEPGVMTVIAGSFGVNAVIANAPVVDRRWACRGHVQPGRWGHSARSAGAASTIDWFIRALYAADDPTAIDWELAVAPHGGESIRFVPPRAGSRLTGYPSPELGVARATVGRGALLRAVLEGLVLGHIRQIEALRQSVPIGEVRLTGGASRSHELRQRFADALDLPVSVAVTESGALGAAICAAVGIGLVADVKSGVEAMVAAPVPIGPDPMQAAGIRASVLTSLQSDGPGAATGDVDEIGWFIGRHSRFAVNVPDP